jgi:diacylglycerol kinase family enzyme
LPRDPVEATAVLIERIRDGVEPATVNLGVVNGRRFAFCAGVGLDAEVVRDVHRRFRTKQRWGEAFFVATAFRTYYTASDRKRTRLSLTFPGGRTVSDVGLAVVGKTDPFTYLGPMALHLTPEATSGGGLDVMTLRSVTMRHTLRAVAGAFRSGRHLKMRSIEYEHDVDRFEIAASQAVALQCDGEYIGQAAEVELRTERAALRVL